MEMQKRLRNEMDFEYRFQPVSKPNLIRQGARCTTNALAPRRPRTL